MYNVTELADYLHSQMCSPVPAPCARYRPETAHHDFYQMRAQNIFQGLDRHVEPDEVLDVVRVIVNEVVL